MQVTGQRCTTGFIMTPNGLSHLLTPLHDLVTFEVHLPTLVRLFSTNHRTGWSRGGNRRGNSNRGPNRCSSSTTPLAWAPVAPQAGTTTQMQAQHLWSPGWVFSFQPQGHVLDQGVELTQWPTLGGPLTARSRAVHLHPEGAPPMAAVYRFRPIRWAIALKVSPAWCWSTISTRSAWVRSRLLMAILLVSLQTRAE